MKCLECGFNEVDEDQYFCSEECGCCYAVELLANEWDNVCPKCESDDVNAKYHSANEETTTFVCRECTHEFDIKTVTKYYV